MGLLGNNLFQYAVARLIAEQHGLALECTNDPLRTPRASRSPATLAALADRFPNAPLTLDGRDVPAPVIAYEMDANNPWNGQTFPFAAVLADPTLRQIRLRGYFQRFEYMADAQERVRQWFRLTPSGTTLVPGPDDVLVNIRRDLDYAFRGWVLPLSYYTTALASLSRVGRVYVCGTGIDDDIRAGLAPYDPTYMAGMPIEHFETFLAFRRLVLSNSTFAWWGAFLSHAVEIYAPRSGDVRGFAFTGWEDVDLHMRQPRYRELLVPTFSRLSHLTVTACAPARIYESSRSIVVEAVNVAGVAIECDRQHRDIVLRLFHDRARLDLTASLRHPATRAAVPLLESFRAAGLVSTTHRCMDVAAGVPAMSHVGRGGAA
jgi:hypothetical protein